MNEQVPKRVMTDGSSVIIEAMARAGVDAYVGYPITPANWLYAYAQKRIPIALAAPDEITALQWSAGFAAAGKMPLTATSFPGFALMIESLNMAYMMELPLVVVLVQRMGPSTGSATTGAQGDLLLLRGCISGGYPLPVFCPSDVTSCWNLAAHAVETALALRTPVVLLTSKEMVMTGLSLDVAGLPEIERAPWNLYFGTEPYQSYRPGSDQVPPFIAVGSSDHQSARRHLPPSTTRTGFGPRSRAHPIVSIASSWTRVTARTRSSSRTASRRGPPATRSNCCVHRAARCLFSS